MKLSKKGQGIIGRLLPAVLIPIVLMVMLAVFTNFESNLDRSGWTEEANKTYDKTRTQSYSGFNLASILPLVVIGVTILGILVTAFVFGR